MTIKCYIAGPMSNLPEQNYPAFHAEAARLRALGYLVENPAENPAPPCKSWKGYMKLSIPQMLTCDVVALLPGWAESAGAIVERDLAQRLGIEVVPAHLIQFAPVPGWQPSIEKDATA